MTLASRATPHERVSTIEHIGVRAEMVRLCAVYVRARVVIGGSARGHAAPYSRIRERCSTMGAIAKDKGARSLLVPCWLS